MHKLAGIILAAGKGTRINPKNVHKVTFVIGGKSLILRSVELLRESGIEEVLVVVGFAKKSVEEALSGIKVSFVTQGNLLGTAHAVESALPALSSGITSVVVIQGDDSYLYTPSVIQELVSLHATENASIAFLSLISDTPQGLGRIIRDANGNIQKIQEEKDANDLEKKIPEINPGCYVFSLTFLQKYLSQVEKSRHTGEQYLTSLIEIGYNNNEKIVSLKKENIKWRGINTLDDLQHAQALYNQNI
jgi:bifunctional N-acetylglucosamine-1-phosphate-uridyltransferase/glucosamine-1-phosphate-acetyltransferase GlmU-like protein